MDQKHAAPSPSFLSRLGKAFIWLVRFLLRLLVVLAVGIAVGAGLYFGGMFAYRQFLEPVPVHTIRLDVLEGRQNQSIERFTQRQDDLQLRVDELEAQSDARKLAFDGLQERLLAAETSQAEAIAGLDEAYVELEQIQATLAEAQLAREAIQAAMDTLQEAQDAGQGDLDALRVDLETLQTSLASIASALETMQDDLGAIQTGLTDLSGQVDEYGMDVAALREELSGETSPTILFQELQLVKAMEFLTRARLMLVQNNLGLAQLDIQAGRTILVDLQAETPVYQSEQIARVVARLDAALDNLPDAPVAATDEVEGAWQLLVAGLPAEPPATPAAEATPVPPTTPEPTATPTTPEPTATPTTQS
jgi:predicted  nucleic acid-binding Zn-ribbon protein